MSELKQTILNTISDIITDFLYYDRKRDESLPLDAIEKAILEGDITKQEIIDAFTKELEGRL